MSSVAGRPRPPLTDEQRRAVEARAGAWLLSANAGSGKTAVMAERFVAAVLVDGVEVERILALTFTEKAAGELRDRIRGRLIAEGAGEHARAAESAWIGTIHGFCARILRAHPLPAGLDPRFEVLDEAAAGRLRGVAWDAAVADWLREGGSEALDVAAAHRLERLRPVVLAAHDELRSRGATAPELPLPALPAPLDLGPLHEAAEAAFAVLAPAYEERRGKQLAERLDVLGRCRAMLSAERGGDLRLAELDALVLKGGSAAALKHEAVERYNAVLADCRQSVLDAIGHAQLRALAPLLARFAERWARLKRERSAVDFEDLELGVRDLLVARSDVRERWSERFELLMVDEFQDTNPLQMELLAALEREGGNLFAVGDEKQSIYGFRHADVRVMRRRRAALGPERTLALRRNFRSREELLDVVNVAFAAEWGERYQPLLAGRRAPIRDGEDLRLFDPDGGSSAADAEAASPAGAPPVELLVVDERDWADDALELAGLDAPAPRRAEAHAVARRVRELIDAGRRPRDVVVLVRATASLRVFEQALEQRGLPTYVVGGRGYWSLEQVRDGIAYLAALENPLDEAALLGVLASPLVGLGTDGLILATEAARASNDGGRGGLWAELRRTFVDAREPNGDWIAELPLEERDRLAAFCRFFAAERAQAARYPIATLLERGIRRTGYDRALLDRPGGDRQLANLRKLIRLARAFEAAEERDLRAFVEHARAQQAALAQAREGDAPLESEDLDAVRLMTIHRAKGLEFPVVVIGDLGRRGQADRGALLVGEDGRVGLRVTTLERESGPSLDYEALADAAATDDDEEERRLFYVALTRAEEQLILSGVVDTARWPEPGAGAPPLLWLARRLTSELPIARTSDDDEDTPPEPPPPRVHEHGFDGRPARVAVTLVTPASTDDLAVASGASESTAPAADPPAPPETPDLIPAGAAASFDRPADPAGAGVAAPGIDLAGPAWQPLDAGPPAPERISYSALAEHERCGYRFYLQRVLGLAEVPPPEPEPAEDEEHQLSLAASAGGGKPASVERGTDVDDANGGWGIGARERGTLVHGLLERIDWRRPAAPAPEDARAIAAEQALGPLGERGAGAAVELIGRFLATPLAERLARARDVRHEAPFAFLLPGAGERAPLVHGRLDVVARERGGRLLIVDYKTDRLAEGDDPAELVERQHATQRATYALAGLRSGARVVEVVYCLLERPDEPVAATFTPGDEPTLAAQLGALAGAALTGPHPVADAPHYDLCATCPGRAALCSHDPSRTSSRRMPTEPKRRRQAIPESMPEPSAAKPEPERTAEPTSEPLELALWNSDA